MYFLLGVLLEVKQRSAVSIRHGRSIGDQTVFGIVIKFGVGVLYSTLFCTVRSVQYIVLNSTFCTARYSEQYVVLNSTLFCTVRCSEQYVLYSTFCTTRYSEQYVVLNSTLFCTVRSVQCVLYSTLF